ncbi:hypothetical protein A3F28_01260 [Candidatus Uhrbacteria bacterium RIFCSPHIGHO2_12_FULL_57_11]|uniref:Uncharacterized protein n=2 Tax=Candidatus Uhriibacteriota TaxID=1752732 RepID=A0A1F7UIH6_9BACT|nr:MAG: hypothetical protein A3D72_03870 [Candidatus Uhrbacteria bacterium RIFCSPHIGHO2_02_FULL_57_19]OGL78052.1 MAG: hypothetical protein A3F28_01260 [Candidatus Uhrbacteria bacterium RIFCSPHIGHO2_12_FULL_57_11]
MGTFNPPINTQEWYDRFSESFDRALTYNEQNEADSFCLFYELFKKDNPGFEAEEPEWATKYEKLYRKAQWVALPLLADDKDVIEMFRQHVEVLLEMPDYELNERFRQRLLALSLPERDPFKAKIKDALIQNQERITDDFTTTVIRTAQKGTVGNWVREFQTFMGKDFTDALLLARFYTESKAFGSQTSEVKEFLKKLFDVVSRLNTSSATAAGFEADRLVDVNGELVEYVHGGTVEDFDESLVALLKQIRPPETEESKREKIKTRFADPPDVAKSIEPLIASLLETAGKDPAALRMAVTKAVVPPAGGKPNRDQVVATLRALARSGNLFEILGDKKLQDLLNNYYEKGGRTQDAESLKVFPNAPEHIKSFVRFVFGELLTMDENEAARQALQIANILRKKGDDRLLDIAFYDESSGEFRWTAGK